MLGDVIPLELTTESDPPGLSNESLVTAGDEIEDTVLFEVLGDSPETLIPLCGPVEELPD